MNDPAWCKQGSLPDELLPYPITCDVWERENIVVNVGAIITQHMKYIIAIKRAKLYKQ